MKLKLLLTFAVMLLVWPLAGCVGTKSTSDVHVDVKGVEQARRPDRIERPERPDKYTAIQDGGHQIAAIPRHKIAPEYRRQIVSYPTRELPGTIIVDTNNKHLYFVMEKGKAMRYGIGVGRDGFRWEGGARIGLKREWPSWTPPAPMIRRQPDLAKYAKGMKGGLSNPLGARALYLYRNGRDTLYRLHGTPEWWTIGSQASSGCIRLMNHDVIDLYDRTKVGAKVIVH